MTHPIFHMVAGAPDPVAPFSHAVEADGWIFVTGQMPFSGTSNTSAYPEGIEAQTRQVMENLKHVLAGCLRNASAVARAARSLGDVVTVIAAGERWFTSDDSLRPAFEDQVGVGAILAHLDDRSPEAQSAVAVFEDASGDLLNRLMNCSSGREVSARGYQDDVQMASEVDVSTTVPILQGEAFIALN